MIGLDTNILVRFLTQEDPVQSSRARQIIERQLTEENPGFVSLAAMFETAWALEKIYKLDRPGSRRDHQRNPPDRNSLHPK
jgi:predicted nucleic-acid-binding protein